MLLCVHVCRCPWRLEEHIGAPGAGVRGNCKQVLYQELHSPTHSRQKICSFPLKFFQNTWQNDKHTSVTVSIDINQKLLRSWVEGISGNIAPVSVELPLALWNLQSHIYLDGNTWPGAAHSAFCEAVCIPDKNLSGGGLPYSLPFSFPQGRLGQQGQPGRKRRCKNPEIPIFLLHVLQFIDPSVRYTKSYTLEKNQMHTLF